MVTLRQNEIEITKSQLTDLLKLEEHLYFKDDEEKIFYLTHKIPFISYLFTQIDNEPFYIIFQMEDYGIYFNDIEECFGICKIENNECYKCAEFYDNLAPTVRKFKKAYENNCMESLFE